MVCKDLKGTSFGSQRGKNDGSSYQHVHAESVSCGTITPIKPQTIASQLSHSLIIRGVSRFCPVDFSGIGKIPG